MKTRLIILTPVFLMCFSLTAFAQDKQKKTSIGDVVMEEYQANGIDAAIKRCEKLQKEKQDEYNWDE